MLKKILFVCTFLIGNINVVTYDENENILPIQVCPYAKCDEF